MGLRSFWGAVMFATVALWLCGATQRERALLPAGDHPLAPAHEVRILEARVAARPDDTAAVRALAQAYLDVHQPGLALVLLEGAAPSVREDLSVRHATARALMDAGRNDEALAMEKVVVSGCLSFAAAHQERTSCAIDLFASAVRRAGILGELVARGIKDAQAHPDETLVAYQNATREARVVAQ